ncbi:Hypothetical protein A7982_09345 [Minicystis rosea]|nr:Hypothetical protein A7982_09345 [Minicystis rosea]
MSHASLPLVRHVVPALFGVLLAGCVAGLDGPPPPAPLPEFQSPAPAPGMVWVAGAWHWNGTDHVWVPGHWVSPPPTP